MNKTFQLSPLGIAFKRGCRSMPENKTHSKADSPQQAQMLYGTYNLERVAAS